MINRSEIKQIEKQNNSKIFFSESEANEYAFSLYKSNCAYRKDQLQVVLDDASSEELALRRSEFDEKVKALQSPSDYYVSLLKSFCTSDTAWEIVFLSDNAEEFYKPNYDILTFDDDVNGATVVY